MAKHKQLLPNDVIAFFRLAEKLKSTYRHAVTSDITRRESTAEHVWMATMLAMVIHPELTVKVDLTKLLKMLVVHDLGEALFGDIPAFVKDKNGYAHLDHERQGLKDAIAPLPQDLQQEILGLFDEFEAMKTITAKVGKAIDRFEAVMQHNLIPIETWDQGDYDIQPYYKDADFNFDPYIRKLKDVIDEETMQKIAKADDLDRIDKKHVKRWRKKK